MINHQNKQTIYTSHYENQTEQFSINSMRFQKDKFPQLSKVLLTL